MGRHPCSGVRVAGVGKSGGVWWATVGVLESVGGRSGLLTPHLTSPLTRGEGPERGRDELGWGGRVPGLAAVLGEIPAASAGMTDLFLRGYGGDGRVALIG